MAGSSWGAFVKSILIPMLIALGFYVAVFLVILPLYRRHRSQLARYSSYTPLSSSLAQRTTSLFEPYLIEPSKSLAQKLREALVKGIRWAVVPSSWAWENRGRTEGGRDGEGDDDENDDAGLFDEESGEAMVGFNVFGEDRGRVRPRAGENTGGNIVDNDDSNRRLSRELEEGFRDDSGSEDSEEQVTVGRRSLSRSGNRPWR